MTYINREIEEKINKFIGRKEIIGIRGPRQAGKTTLLKNIYEKINENKVYIDMYIDEYRKNFEENYIDFIKRYKDEKKLFLFLDEIQKLKDGGKILKIIYDNFNDIKIFISGSSTLEINTKILPDLVGRLILFTLYPFNFYEFLLSKDKGLANLVKEKRESLRGFLEKDDEIKKPSFNEEIIKYLKEYLIYGGYPEVSIAKDFEEKKILLKNLYNLYIEKDIVNFFHIYDSSKFIDLTRYLSFIIGNILDISSVSKELKISYRKVENYITILKHTYIIDLIEPFHKNVVTELKKAKKIYFIDLGLRNSVIDNFLEYDKRTDKEQLLENFVYIELLKNFSDWKINYWRTTGKAEIDFILTKGDKIIPIEVKTSRRINKGFYTFIKKYKPEKGLIITLDEFEVRDIYNTKVYIIPAYYI
jgi:hypothetical protein